MMPWGIVLAISVVSISSLCHQAASQTCEGKFLQLPLRNVTLANGVALNRGIYTQIGNQQLGLRTSFVFNNTRIRNAVDCTVANGTVPTGCFGFSGGVYDVKSLTWTVSSPNNFEVAAVDQKLGPGEQDLYGYDQVQLDNGPLIKSFPLEIWSDQKSPLKSAIGLGRNSSFVQKLYDEGLVSSKLIGLHFGSRSQDYATDGLLTIGAIDEGAVNGNFTTFPMQTDLVHSVPVGPLSSLQVLIKDVILTNSRGSFSLMADNSTYLPAAIDPYQNTIPLTKTMYARWANLTEHSSTIEYSQQIYPLENEDLLGTLTFVLSNNYTTEIPHYELVSLVRDTDSQGKYDIIDRTKLMSSVSDNGGNGPVVLGGVYLAMNYLAVDYEKNHFMMAPAKNGSLSADQHNFKPFCSSNTTASIIADSSKGESNRHTAVIVGCVLGGVLLLVLAVTGLYVHHLYVRYHQQTDCQQVGSDPKSSKEHVPETERRSSDPAIEPEDGLSRKPSVVTSEFVVSPMPSPRLTRRASELPAVREPGELEGRDVALGVAALEV